MPLCLWVVRNPASGIVYASCLQFGRDTQSSTYVPVYLRHIDAPASYNLRVEDLVHRSALLGLDHLASVSGRYIGGGPEWEGGRGKGEGGLPGLGPGVGVAGGRGLEGASTSRRDTTSRKPLE